MTRFAQPTTTQPSQSSATPETMAEALRLTAHTIEHAAAWGVRAMRACPPERVAEALEVLRQRFSDDIATTLGEQNAIHGAPWGVDERRRWADMMVAGVMELVQREVRPS